MATPLDTVASNKGMSRFRRLCSAVPATYAFVVHLAHFELKQTEDHQASRKKRRLDPHPPRYIFSVSVPKTSKNRGTPNSATVFFQTATITLLAVRANSNLVGRSCPLYCFVVGFGGRFGWFWLAWLVI